MSSLETAQSIWETATKKFDKIDNKEKEEWFLSLIDQINENNTIQWCKKQWDQMTEEQKLKLYNRWAITVWNTIKNQPVIKIPRSYIDWTKNTMKHWVKNAARFKFLEEIPARFFVEFWIFDKPEGLTDKQLCKDIKSDAKNYNLYLWICETVCKAIPEAKAVVPFISMARHYTKRYKDNWTETIISRLNQKKESAIKEQTNQELAEVMEDSQTPIKKAA